MRKTKSKYSKRKPAVRLWSWESDRSTEKRFVHAQERVGPMWKPITSDYVYEKGVVQPRNWVLMIRAILWYDDGKVDTNTVIRTAKNATLLTLEQEAKAMRKEAIKTTKREHIVDVGWFAYSYNGSKPPEVRRQDEVALGHVSEQRQMLWNLSYKEEVAAIVECAA